MNEVRGDLHIHTTLTNEFPNLGDLTPEMAFVEAQKRGLGVISLTEHDQIHDYDKTEALAARMGIIWIPAVEVTATNSDHLRSLIQIHLLAYGVTDPITPGLSVPEATEQIRRKNGIAILAHPFANTGLIGYSAEQLYQFIQRSGLQGLETANSQILQSWNRKAARMAERFSLARVGGSDARHARRIGRCYTLFSPQMKLETWQDCMKAILDGRTEGMGVGRKIGPFFA